MIYRLLAAFAIISSLILVLSSIQSVNAIERNVGSTSHEALSVVNYHDLNEQISGSVVTEEFIGRVVPSKGITSKGMLVEETPQTGAYFIRTIFTPGVLIILAGMIILKKRVL